MSRLSLFSSLKILRRALSPINRMGRNYKTGWGLYGDKAGVGGAMNGEGVVARRPTTVPRHVHGTTVPRGCAVSSADDHSPLNERTTLSAVFKAPRAIPLPLTFFRSSMSSAGFRTGDLQAGLQRQPGPRHPSAAAPAAARVTYLRPFALVPPRSGVCVIITIQSAADECFSVLSVLCV